MLRFGLCGNVPTAVGQGVVHTHLHVLGVKPRLLELDVDARTVARVLRVGHISIVKVIVYKVHVFSGIGVRHPGVVAFGSAFFGIVNLLECHVLVLVLDVVGKHALAIGIAAQHFALGIGHLVLQGRHILVYATLLGKGSASLVGA